MLRQKNIALHFKVQAYANAPHIMANKEYVTKITKNSAYQNVGGVYCKVIKQGNGTIPTDESMVRVPYEGRTIDGIFLIIVIKEVNL